ncbi:MAG: hypothetical protein RL757_2440 [Bacteroidota bacterium]|jgi:hypothetical protein
MKFIKSYLTIFFVFNALVIFAQQADLQAFNARRIKDAKTDMLLLGGWAAGNMVLSGALMGNAKGVTRGYHQMNIGWNAVNLTIAGFGYYAAMKSNAASFDLYGTISEHYSVQKVFLFNAGLDVGYMAAGAWLIEKSKTTTKDPLQMKGFGQAVAVNGAFLFVFDLANYFIQSGHNDKVKLLLSNNGMGLSLHF